MTNTDTNTQPNDILFATEEERAAYKLLRNRRNPDGTRRYEIAIKPGLPIVKLMVSTGSATQ